MVNISLKVTDAYIPIHLNQNLQEVQKKNYLGETKKDLDLTN